jgi:hypothetical protein
MVKIDGMRTETVLLAAVAKVLVLPGLARADGALP